MTRLAAQELEALVAKRKHQRALRAELRGDSGKFMSLLPITTSFAAEMTDTELYLAAAYRREAEAKQKERDDGRKAGLRNGNKGARRVAIKKALRLLAPGLQGKELLAALRQKLPPEFKAADVTLRKDLRELSAL